MSIDGKEDTQIIQSILNGNKKIEKELYDKYSQIFSRYLSRKYPKNNYIDDDVSEVMTKILLNLNKFDSRKSKFNTWAFNIMNNHMIDKYRKSITTTRDFNEIEYQYIERNQCDINKFENNDAVSYLLNQLDSSDSTYLNLHYIHGYSYSEIGLEFNLTSTTISNRVNYIKSKLKKKINEKSGQI